MPWTPTVFSEEWGTLQLVVGNTDVTYFRNVITQIKNVVDNEPFGWVSLTVGFPQITTFEALPAWLYDHAPVELYRVLPDGSKETRFEGLFIDEEDSISETENNLTVTFAGALYQADFYKKAPEISQPDEPGMRDVAFRIRAELDPAARPALRTLPVIVPGTSGVPYTEGGNWGNLLTDYIQSMLAVSGISGYPAPGEGIVGITLLPGGTGYFLTGSKGSVIVFGAARYQGSTLSFPLNEPGSRIAVHPSGTGYWLAARDGGVFAFNVPFYGSLGANGNPNDIVGIEAMPDGLGYRLVDTIGGTFDFGSATHIGTPPTLPANVKIADFAHTPSGAGFWLMSDRGHIYAYGDASYQGGAEATGKIFVAMSVRVGGGYWLLSADGYVYGYGAAAGVIGTNPVPVTNGAVDIVGSTTGAGYLVVDGTGGVFAYGDAQFHGSVPGGNGTASQWTLHCDPGRRPVFRVKNTWDVHWAMSVGSPGLEHSLKRDLTQSPNVWYGEGVDPNGCRWRGTRYPNIRPDTAPVFNGTTIVVGATSPQVEIWKREMHERWASKIVVDTTFSQSDSNEARRFQRQAGLTETGTVNAQTWAATFQVGSNGGDLRAPFFYPLALDLRTEPYLYNATGARIGSNSSFDRRVVAVEGYTNYGNNATKDEGLISANIMLHRDRPAYLGTLTLKTDPETGSRYDIRSGQNIRLRHHRGTGADGRVFHVAGVTTDWDSEVVTLTVDERARDWMTVAAIQSRLRDSYTPTRKREYRNARSVDIPDQGAIFDCEGGAGVIPRHAISDNLWNIVRIPMARVGTVRRVEIETEDPARFSVGVFDRLVTANFMASLGDSPLESGYWDQFEEETGLIQAWGEDGQAGGYYPGRESDGDEVTGRMVDDAQWYFESSKAPWLWVALWCEDSEVNYISGRMWVESEGA